jgi:beta-propeller repeat-containing protein
VVPAVDDCQTPQDEDCDGTPAVCGGGVAWSRGYGDIDPSLQGVTHDHTLGGMATDGAGNVYIVGNYSSTMDFGAAGQLAHTPGATGDAFLAKIGPNGAPIWAKQFGGVSSNVSANAVAVDPQGNVTIVGNVNGSVTIGGVTFTASSGVDVFVASFTANGVYRYSKGFPGPGMSSAIAIAAAPNGDVAFTGQLGGAVTFGGNNLSPQGTSDVFVVKLDVMGNHVMSKRFGDSALQAGTSVAFTPTGNVVLAGYSAGTIDFGGGPLTATGASCSTAVAELNGATGSHVWSKLFDHGPTSDCTFRRVAVDPAGNVLVSTASNGNVATQVDFGGGPRTGIFFLVKLSPAGSHVWSRGWTGKRGVWGLATDPSGNILITGLLSSPIDFGTGVLTPFDGWDGFVAKLDPQGDGVWARSVSDSNQQSNVQWGYAIASDAAGNVFAGGRLSGAINLGDGEILGEKGFSSGNDVYLAKFAP